MQTTVKKEIISGKRPAVRKRSRLGRGILWASVCVLSAVLAVLTAICLYLSSAQVAMAVDGPQELTVEYGTDFQIPGAEAYITGGLTEIIPQNVEVMVRGEVDTSVVGDYTLRYHAEHVYDSFLGKVVLKAAQDKLIHVVDTQAPVITLVSDPDGYTLPGQTYAEEGFTASDGYDGDLTHLVERIATEKTVTYRVSDAAGNTAEVVRTIVYYDPEPPVLSLLGSTEMLVYQDEGYTEPGFSATDNCDGDLSASVTVSGKVDMDNPGTYVLEYSVSDSYNNTAKAQRTVRVSKWNRFTDIAPVSVPVPVTPEGKVIYLTFDDGPSAHTPKLLETLEKYGVKATFFVVNTTYASYIEDIAKAGHTLAMHTYTHKFENVYSSEKAYFEDLQKIQDLIYKYSGERPTILRFPGGSSNTISRRYSSGIMTRLSGYLNEMGYRFFDWNVDSRDAGGAKTSDEVFRNVTGQIRRNELTYSVVLQHDTHSFSVRAVERIIQWGLENGYTFMTLDPTSPVCKHEVNN